MPLTKRFEVNKSSANNSSSYSLQEHVEVKVKSPNHFNRCISCIAFVADIDDAHQCGMLRSSERIQQRLFVAHTHARQQFVEELSGHRQDVTESTPQLAWYSDFVATTTSDALAIQVLHWLCLPERVNFKLARMEYRVLNGMAHRIWTTCSCI